MTLAGNTEQIFRIIQSIPSKKQNHLKYGSRASDTNEYRRLTTQKKALNRSREFWQKMGRSEKMDSTTNDGPGNPQ